MVNIVILGSQRFAPYRVSVPDKRRNADGSRAIDWCDEVWVYAPNGVDEEMEKEIDYAIKRRKKVLFVHSVV